MLVLEVPQPAWRPYLLGHAAEQFCHSATSALPTNSCSALLRLPLPACTQYNCWSGAAMMSEEGAEPESLAGWRSHYMLLLSYNCMHTTLLARLSAYA
jgi:hypothetical protein